MTNKLTKLMLNIHYKLINSENTVGKCIEKNHSFILTVTCLYLKCFLVKGQKTLFSFSQCEKVVLHFFIFYEILYNKISNNFFQIPNIYARIGKMSFLLQPANNPLQSLIQSENIKLINKHIQLLFAMIFKNC